MHIHPAKASGLTWGCGSTPKWAHVLVYWVAPFLGTWIAFKASRVITINRGKPIHEKKTENDVTKTSPDEDTVEVKGQVRKRKK